MPVFPLKRNLHVAIGCALVGALLVAAAPARAQQDESAPEVKILDSVMGALGQYGLDMMGYAQVATAWGQKLAGDPTLNAKFGAMMAR